MAAQSFMPFIFQRVNETPLIARYGCRRAFSAGNAFEKSFYDALDKVKVKSNPIAINKTRNWNARTKNRGKSAAKVKTRKGKTDGQREC